MLPAAPFLLAVVLAVGGGGPGGGDPPLRSEPQSRRPLARAPRHAPALPGGFAFVDATASAGIVDRGISFGVAVGDADGDGWPDVFTSGHYTAHPRLWRNQGNGAFVDATSWLQPPPTGDLHAAQWVDLDNDGQQELVLLSGASYGTSAEPKRVYRRVGNRFVDVAPQWGLDPATMRGRTPLAIDQDRDGLLDLFFTAALRPDGLTPPTLYRQRQSRFRDVGAIVGFGVQTATTFGVLGDLDGDGDLDAFFEGLPNRAYALDPTGVQDITAAIGLPPLPPFPMLQDAVVADLTGDGRSDMYLARETNRSSVHRDGPFTIEFCALVDGDEQGARFSSLPGHVLWVDWGDLGAWSTNDVHIGAQGLHPTSWFGVPLDPADPNVHGIAPHAPGQARGLYVGWDAALGEWVMAVSAPTQQEAHLRAISSSPVSPPTPVGFVSSTLPSDLLLVRTPTGFVDRTAANGVPAWMRGRSAVAADFDNDMDLDLYVVRASQSCNLDNVLLENLGGGVFQPVPGVATGSSDGIGDAAAALDYDRDGRVDLALVNGHGRAFRGNGAPGAFADDGPTQLLRNVNANGNHWLGVRLVGTASNREGIGARIELRCGGVSQWREHGGGMHRSAQDHGIHFGLGQNTAVEYLRVCWPSGSATVVRRPACDQVVNVVE